MTLSRHNGGVVILITFIIALVLTVFPLPEWARELRPQWVSLVLIYWCLALPQRIGVFSGFLVGIVVDVLTGTLLGQHALAYSVIAFLALKLHQRVRVFPLIQQAMIVFLLLLAERLLTMWVMGAIHLPPPSLWYWFPPVLGMFLWPWVFAILRETRRQFHVS